MDTLPDLFSDAVRVVGWTLLHFVWQGAAIGAMYALVRTRVPRGRGRYLLGLGALCVLALCPLATSWSLFGGAVGVAAEDPVSLPIVDASTSPNGLAPSAWRSVLDGALPWLVASWACGVLVLTLRAWHHWHGIKRLVREALPLSAWETQLRDISRRLGLKRRVRLLWSQHVSTPTLIGWLRPVILLPAAVALGFPAAQVELILAHELGHIRRWDHLANLFQLVLETVLFYHPVVHWISRDVRNEREICCDELVLEVTGGSPRVYVEALADLEDLRHAHPGLVLAASGGALVERVRRIAGLPLSPNPVRPQARFVIGLLASVLAAAIVHQQLARLDATRLANLAATIARVRTVLAPQIAPLPIAAERGVADVVPRALSTHIRPVVAQDAAPPTVASPLAALQPTNAVPSPVVDSPASTGGTSSVSGGELVTPLGASVTADPRVDTPAAAPPLAPVVLSFRRPLYPMEARTRGLEGKVEFEFALTDEGKAADVRIVAANPAGVFDNAAMRALQGSRFAPAAAARSGQRYRETFVFSMHARDAASTSSVDPQPGCRIVTGSHICRRVEDVKPDPQLRTYSPAGA